MCQGDAFASQALRVETLRVTRKGSCEGVRWSPCRIRYATCSASKRYANALRDAASSTQPPPSRGGWRRWRPGARRRRGTRTLGSPGSEARRRWPGVMWPSPSRPHRHRTPRMLRTSLSLVPRRQQRPRSRVGSSDQETPAPEAEGLLGAGVLSPVGRTGPFTIRPAHPRSSQDSTVTVPRDAPHMDLADTAAERGYFLNEKPLARRWVWGLASR